MIALYVSCGSSFSFHIDINLATRRTIACMRYFTRNYPRIFIGVAILVASCPSTAGFAVGDGLVALPHHSRRSVKFPLQAGDGELSSKRSVARAGGRKSKVSQKPPNNNNNDDSRIALLKQWAVSIIISVLLLRFLFGGLLSVGNTNYVYYTRSVYQSTTYSSDGNIETERRETFNSNVPGLIERSKVGSTSNSAIIDELENLEDEIFDAFNVKSW